MAPNEGILKKIPLNQLRRLEPGMLGPERYGCEHVIPPPPFSERSLVVERKVRNIKKVDDLKQSFDPELTSDPALIDPKCLMETEIINPRHRYQKPNQPLAPSYVYHPEQAILDTAKQAWRELGNEGGGSFWENSILLPRLAAIVAKCQQRSSAQSELNATYVPPPITVHLLRLLAQGDQSASSRSNSSVAGSLLSHILVISTANPQSPSKKERARAKETTAVTGEVAEDEKKKRKILAAVAGEVAEEKRIFLDASNVARDVLGGEVTMTVKELEDSWAAKSKLAGNKVEIEPSMIRAIAARCSSDWMGEGRGTMIDCDWLLRLLVGEDIAGMPITVTFSNRHMRGFDGQDTTLRLNPPSSCTMLQLLRLICDRVPDFRLPSFEDINDFNGQTWECYLAMGKRPLPINQKLAFNFSRSKGPKHHQWRSFIYPDMAGWQTHPKHLNKRKSNESLDRYVANCFPSPTEMGKDARGTGGQWSWFPPPTSPEMFNSTWRLRLVDALVPGERLILLPGPSDLNLDADPRGKELRRPTELSGPRYGNASTPVTEVQKNEPSADGKISRAEAIRLTAKVLAAQLGCDEALDAVQELQKQLGDPENTISHAISRSFKAFQGGKFAKLVDRIQDRLTEPGEIRAHLERVLEWSAKDVAHFILHKGLDGPPKRYKKDPVWYAKTFRKEKINGFQFLALTPGEIWQRVNIVDEYTRQRIEVWRSKLLGVALRRCWRTRPADATKWDVRHVAGWLMCALDQPQALVQAALQLKLNGRNLLGMKDETPNDIGDIVEMLFSTSRNFAIEPADVNAKVKSEAELSARPRSASARSSGTGGNKHRELRRSHNQTTGENANGDELKVTEGIRTLRVDHSSKTPLASTMKRVDESKETKMHATRSKLQESDSERAQRAERDIKITMRAVQQREQAVSQAIHHHTTGEGPNTEPIWADTGDLVGVGRLGRNHLQSTVTKSTETPNVHHLTSTSPRARSNSPPKRDKPGRKSKGQRLQNQKKQDIGADVESMKPWDPVADSDSWNMTNLGDAETRAARIKRQTEPLNQRLLEHYGRTSKSNHPPAGDASMGELVELVIPFFVVILYTTHRFVDACCP